MNYSKLTPYFTFTNAQRKGLLLLFSIIIAGQLFFFLTPDPTYQEEIIDHDWLLVQNEIDSLKQLRQRQVPKIYPFNPNFISDFKGYKMGMSVAEIDRLLAFRNLNKYVNSAAEFQAVTRISDSLLAVLSPYFKFPEWASNKPRYSAYDNKYVATPTSAPRLDINAASAEDLVKVYGIGPALSERILKQKELLGGFVNMTQMEDIWGLSQEVIGNLNRKFSIVAPPQVKRIAINKASVKELSHFPYFRYAVAKEIVTYRSMNGDIKSTADLVKIKGLSEEKVDIIAVYLEF